MGVTYTEIGLDRTSLDADERELVRKLTTAIVILLKPGSGSVTASVLQSAALTVLADFREPFEVWESIKGEVERHLPEAVRANCAGEG